MKIRFAILDDLPKLTAIYNQAIESGESTGDTSPYKISDRLEWFNSFDSSAYPLYVVEKEGEVVGYCSLSPYRKGRKAMESVAEISYYLDFSFHNIGIGSNLMNYVINDCKRIRKNNLIAILLDCNKASIGLLQKFGFKPWGFFPDIVKLEKKTVSQIVYGLHIND